MTLCPREAKTVSAAASSWVLCSWSWISDTFTSSIASHGLVAGVVGCKMGASPPTRRSQLNPCSWEPLLLPFEEFWAVSPPSRNRCVAHHHLVPAEQGKGHLKYPLQQVTTQHSVSTESCAIRLIESQAEVMNVLGMEPRSSERRCHGATV